MARLIQVRDEGQLDHWCDEALRAQPDAAEDFRGGKDAALGRLVGEVMKLSRGQADARAVREKLAGKLRGGITFFRAGRRDPVPADRTPPPRPPDAGQQS